MTALDPIHFDVVVVDEFHHAAAASVREGAHHLEPVELLGLTATPERSDGLPVLHWFDDRIAAELRLWDAIDQQHLAPFLYFGDRTTVSTCATSRGAGGRGYDVEALTNRYTSSDVWADSSCKQFTEHARRRDRCAASGSA